MPNGITRESVLAAAQRMLDRGTPMEQVKAFVDRARERAQSNAKDQQKAKELSAGGKTATFLDRISGSASFGVGPLVGDAIAAGLDGDKSFKDVRAERSDRNAQLGNVGYAADVMGGLLTGGGVKSLGGVSLNAIKGLAGGGLGKKALVAAGDAALQGGVTGGVEGLDDLTFGAIKRASGKAAAGAGAGAFVGGSLGATAGKAAKMWTNRSLGKELAKRGVNVKTAEVLSAQLAEASPNDIAAALQRVDEFVAAGRGAEVMPADVLGEAGGDLLRAASNVSSKARQKAGTAIRQRDAKIGERKIGDLAAATGTTPEDITRSVTQQIDARSAAAAPLYDAFRSLGDLPVTKELDELRKLPIISQAIRTVKSESPELARLKWNDARVLDAAYKRVGSRAFKATHGYEPGEARMSLLDAIDAASGGKYRPAVETFADKSAAMEAYEAGTGLLGKTKGMGELALRDAGSEADMVRRGHLDAMAGKINAKTPNADLEEAARGANAMATSGVGTRAEAGMVKTLHGDPALKTLENRARKEAAFAKTSNAVQGNSTTARQVSGINDLLGVTSDIASGFSLNPAWWATMTGRRLAADEMQAIQKVIAKGKANTVAEALTQAGDSKTRSVLEDLLAEIARKQAATAQGTAVRRATRTATARAAAPND
jgi:hypothetical protein